MINRRRFLHGLGSTGLFPILSSLAPRMAHAAETAFPTRFLVFYTPNGTNPQTWFPTPGATADQFTLTDLHKALIPHKSDVMFLSGVDMLACETGPGEPHQQGMGGLLTGTHLQDGMFVGGDGSLAGWSDGISLDQALANIVGVATPRKSLELGVRVLGSQVRHRISYAGPAQPLPPLVDPHGAWETLFNGLNPGPAPINDPALKRRHDVLSAAYDQFKLVRRRVSAQDRAKLDLHAHMIREIEQKLQLVTEVGGACEKPVEPGKLADPQDENMMPLVVQLQIDNMVMAMACDVTRVGTLQMSSGANNIRFPFLDSYADDHSLSHAGASDTVSQGEWAIRQAWYSEWFAYLLARLKSIPEGDGNMLDNTIILWGSDIAQGNTHSHHNMPFVLAGHGGGLKPGRFLQFDGKWHNDLLVSIQNLMGVESSTFGDPNFVTGPLPGLTG